MTAWNALSAGMILPLLNCEAHRWSVQRNQTSRETVMLASVESCNFTHQCESFRVKCAPESAVLRLRAILE